MADQYLKGTAVAGIPAIVVDIDYCTINAALAEALDIKIPDADTLGYTINLYENK